MRQTGEAMSGVNLAEEFGALVKAYRQEAGRCASPTEREALEAEANEMEAQYLNLIRQAR